MWVISPDRYELSSLSIESRIKIYCHEVKVLVQNGQKVVGYNDEPPEERKTKMLMLV